MGGMDDPQTLERMRADWNARAREDANYYVAFGRRDQDDDEFFATAAGPLEKLTSEWKRLRGREAALEIGCGPGRLMRPLSGHFGEIHGVDVSDRMIRLARERLASAPNAFPQHNSGADLALYPNEKFDFVYSFAVFQHIPSREVVFEYLRESRRTLKTGGVLRCQFNGLPPCAKACDTWGGVRMTPEELAQFAREHDFQLLALEHAGTQYMWMTCRKAPAGWTRSLAAAPPPGDVRIRSVSNALTGEAVAPASGPLAAISVWIERLPADCDLNHLALAVDGRACRVLYIGEPAADGVTQVNAAMPEGVRTGVAPIEAAWLGRPLCAPGWVRVVPEGPAAPRLLTITDGVDLLSGPRIVSRAFKVMMMDVPHPERFRAAVDHLEIAGVESLCVDPVARQYEFNVYLPKSVRRGPHEVRVSLGGRAFAPVRIEVA
jgi:SAM-dependent methyltransferase